MFLTFPISIWLVSLFCCLILSLLTFRHFRFKSLLSLSQNKYIPEKKSLGDMVKRAYPNSNFDDSFSEGKNQPISYQNHAVHLKQELGIPLDKLSVMSGLGESAWYGATAIHNLHAIDVHFYDTIAQLSHTQMNSIADLHSSMQDWAHHWYGGLTNGAINKLQGHLAEQWVADHLQQMGHHVVMAENSNEPGLIFG